jgi:hypothetical protein
MKFYGYGDLKQRHGVFWLWRVIGIHPADETHFSHSLSLALFNSAVVDFARLRRFSKRPPDFLWDFLWIWAIPMSGKHLSTWALAGKRLARLKTSDRLIP